MLTKELKDWLRKEFYYSNHSKYKHYFDEWVSNITEGQILGFTKQMYNVENNVLGINVRKY